MSGKTDKQRIVALQKALRIARQALQAVQHHGRHTPVVDEALDEINRLDWNSKPDLVQDRRSRL